MINLKQLILGLVSLNALLIIIFVNMSLREPTHVYSNLHTLSEDRRASTRGGSSGTSTDALNSDDFDIVTIDDAPKGKSIQKKSITNKKSDDKNTAGASKATANTDNKAKKGEKLEARNFTKPGVRQPSAKQAEALNKDKKDSRDDAMLSRLSESFKQLQSHYKELNKKYENLEKENKKLEKKGEKMDKKHSQLRTWYEAKKRFYDNSKKKIQKLDTRTSQVQTVLRYSNPFYLLGAYPNVTLDYFNSYPDGRPFYNKMNYGLYNDNDYCELVDFYNLAHPENMFKRRNFFTDYAKKNGLARMLVMRKIGFDLSSKISKYMPRPLFKSRSFHLDPRITTFFTKRVDLHIYHEIGKHFLCATQMYNHIPGHGVLKRKDMIVDSVDAYALRYKENSHCFNKHTFFPFSYRLYIEEECRAFFKEINSKNYKKKLTTDPIQYVIKIGYGSHRAQGVFLFDTDKTTELKQEYDNGKKCGVNNQSLVAQTYVTNPLLLDFNNKFDFRVYMLVASTNPLIAYYHDGFLRVSLHPYDKFSNDRSTHLTNTHLSKDIFAEVRDQNKTLNGMTEEELRNYQMWSLERLRDYLLESGKITDPNWLDNYLRPQFRQAFVHIVRMTAGSFWKQSNVFEMFGLDFMLDDNLNLWFIECNSSPQLIGTNDYKTKFLVTMLRDLFEIQYAYYRSRMQRLLGVIKQMQQESEKDGNIDYGYWRQEYARASSNRLEPEFTIRKANSFVKIIDKNELGPKAYFGNLRDECVDD